VLIEVDSGIGRTGVSSAEAAVALADRIADLPGLALSGVLGYAGGYIAGDADRAALGSREGAGAAAVADALRAAGHAIGIVSVGSTPTAPHAAAVPGVTEVRPGNYVFYDLMQVSIGTATLDDCALTILATVVSHPTPRRYVLDAGIKTLAGEDYGWGTYGRLLEHPEVVLTRATEEHGIIELPEDVADPGLHVGDTVRIVPDHACGTANMQDLLIAVEDDRIVDRWPVIARGRVR
jgi:D-serine deaminase-like pyridoxal phosphate-dependent protein